MTAFRGVLRKAACGTLAALARHDRFPGWRRRCVCDRHLGLPDPGHRPADDRSQRRCPGDRVAGDDAVAANSFQGSGTVTRTTITPTRVVGTFTFTAPGVLTSTFPATKTVMQGEFDVRSEEHTSELQSPVHLV